MEKSTHQASSHLPSQQCAAFIMKADRWEAGSALMRTSSPYDWRDVVNAAHLVQANQR